MDNAEFIMYAILFGFLIYLAIRNLMVFRLRNRVIDTIFSKEDWEWRRTEYLKVSYYEMVFIFWLPVFDISCAKYFYEDAKFLE